MPLLSAIASSTAFSSLTDEDDTQAYTLGSKDSDDEESEGVEDEDFDLDDSKPAPQARAVLNLEDDGIEEVPPPALVGVKSPPYASFSRVSSLPTSIQQAIIKNPPNSFRWTPAHVKMSYKDFMHLTHQFCAVHIPSGVCFHDTQDIGVSMKVYGNPGEQDYYLMIEFKWPCFFVAFDGWRFVNFLKNKCLNRNGRKWNDPNNKEVREWAEQQFQKTWVMFESAWKQEVLHLRRCKNTEELWSETTIKMDFPVERLTSDCWDVIGNERGCRMLVVDLEQATEDDEYAQDDMDRQVEIIKAKEEKDKQD